MNDVWSDNPLRLDGSRVIDRSIYVDPLIYEAERERLFAATWQWVAHESELPNPGDYVTAAIAGRPVAVTRGRDGQVAAFINTCTHRGAVLAPLSRGSSPGGFTCFYHAWSFGTDGKFLAAPIDGAYGGNLARACYDAPKVRSEIFAGHIFVSLDPGIEPLVEFLGEAGPYIERFTGRHEALGRVRWQIEGNWKLWHENFCDNYHPMFTHPILTANYQGVKIEGVNIDLGRGHGVLGFPSQGNPGQIQATIRKLTGKPLEGDGLRREPPKDPSALSHFIMAVFPNLDFQNSGAGQMQNVLQTVRPLSIDRAVVEIVAFGEVGESDGSRQAKLDRCLDGQTAAGKISGDDNEAARRCAAGFGAFREVGWSNMDRGQAGGNQGAKNDEHTLRGFYRAYKQYMGQSL